MLRIIDLGSLLDEVGRRGIMSKEEEGRIFLSRGGENVLLHRRDLVKFIFGPERVAAFARDLFPIPLYFWILDHI
jgi:hypothetical protein